MSDTRVIAGMKVFGLNVPNTVGSVRCLELSKEARHRLKVIQWYEAHNRNGRLTCRHFGISPDTFHRWKRRYEGGGPGALEDGSHRPKRVRRPTWTGELEKAVLELRRGTGWGKDKLAVLLREHGWPCSISMVGRILRKLKENGRLVEAPGRDPWIPRRPFRRPYGVRKPSDYLPKAPGDIVQVDTAHVALYAGFHFKHFTACDVFSRWQVLEAHSRATAHAAAGFLDTIIARMPFPVRAIQVDGGSEFMAQFETACKERGIHLFVLPPRSPKLNGHVERAQRTHRQEFYCRVQLPNSLKEVNRELRRWENVHNCYRPHQALGYKTPKAFLEKLAA
jgi:putative transposase